MRKGPGRSSSFGQNFLIFLLVCAAGYNAWETAQLKNEVTELKAKRRPAGAAPNVRLDDSDAKPSSLFEQAQREVSEAEAKLHIKDYAKARTDLQNGVASLERANAQTRAEGEKVLAELRTAAQGLQDKTIEPAKGSAQTGHKSAKDGGDAGN